MTLHEKRYKFDFTDQLNKCNPDLYKDLITQMIDQYGVNISYIPFDITDTGCTVDHIWGELEKKVWNDYYEMRVFLEDMTLLGGQGDVFAKFGLQIQDEITLFVSIKDFRSTLNDSIAIPTISDLVWMEMYNSLFEVTFVEDQENKLLGQDVVWKLICKKYVASAHEEINTGISVIDDIANDSDNTIEYPDGTQKDFGDVIEDEADELQDDSDGEDPFGDF